MQPENQPGNPVSPAQPAPQTVPQQPVYQQGPPVQAPIATLQPAPQAVQANQVLQPPMPQALPVAPPVQPQPIAQAPIQQPVVPQPQVTSPAPVAPVQQPVVQRTEQSEQQAAGGIGSVAVADQIDGGYSYDAGVDETYDEEAEIDLSEPVTWQAKEFIHQEKNTTWFIAFAVIIALFLGIAILLMRSWSFAILLVVIAVVIVVLSKRPPRVMDYALSEDGLHIDNTVHRYEDFKSFGVVRDSGEFSVMLIPRRRFMPGISVYFPEEAGEDIVDVLGSRLPMKELHLDIIDNLVRKLRL